MSVILWPPVAGKKAEQTLTKNADISQENHRKSLKLQKTFTNFTVSLRTHQLNLVRYNENSSRFLEIMRNVWDVLKKKAHYIFKYYMYNKFSRGFEKKSFVATMSIDSERLSHI